MSAALLYSLGSHCIHSVVPGPSGAVVPSFSAFIACLMNLFVTFICLLPRVHLATFSVSTDIANPLVSCGLSRISPMTALAELKSKN